MDKKLEVKNLQISFRTQNGNVKAVRDISFDLYKGETLAIVGESGSGKSVTSKAIIGILAGNSIVEGGEILYDGQDLLKISEEDFHKLRGDKIAMIFQDPMSSLNPIMKVGKQLTEAMLLKGKSSQRNARHNFNTKLNLLNKNMNILASGEEESKQNDENCHTFDNFCIKSTILENAYNDANAHNVALQLSIDDALFLHERKQKIDLTKSLSDTVKHFDSTVHPFEVVKTPEVVALLEEIQTYLMNKDAITTENTISYLTRIKEILIRGSEVEKPNYFTLGYYVYKNPEFQPETFGTVQELNAMTRKNLDESFMLDFIQKSEKALKYSATHSCELKAQGLPLIARAKEFYAAETLDKKEAYAIAKELGKSVSAAIDRLSIHKNSVEYSFYPTIQGFLHSYFSGLKQNPKNTAKHERKLAKYNKLVESGKKPTWKVVPPVLTDLDLVKRNIGNLLTNLEDCYNKTIAAEPETDYHALAIELIDYFKEQASNVVNKITRKMAKAKALKLLEEVGIPEPQIRFNQYPFEFSGGMRQRIVIAIALSANPDILICDEPTTALDVTIQSQILELINKIKDERNLSVIFITHDLGVVANMADRIAVMYAGKIVEYGTSEDIFYDPRHPYTWALLSSMPDLDTKEKLEAIPGTPPNMIYPPKGDAFAERNKYALEIDFELQPPLFEITDTHYAATWLLHPNAPKVNPPKIISERINRMKKEAAKNGK